ncbi:hypothetical protein ABPG74_016631 [Tetrahymena malaccensis]
MTQQINLSQNSIHISSNILKEYASEVLNSLGQIKIESRNITLEQIQSMINNSINEQKEQVIAQLMNKIASLEQEKAQYKQKNSRLKQLLKESRLQNNEQANKFFKFGDISSINHVDHDELNMKILKNDNLIKGKDKFLNEQICKCKGSLLNSVKNQNFNSEMLSKKVHEQQEKLKVFSEQLLKNKNDLLQVEALQKGYLKTIQAQKEAISELEYEKNNLLNFLKQINKSDQSIIGQESSHRTAELIQNQSIQLNEKRDINSIYQNYKQFIPKQIIKNESYETKLSSLLSFSKDLDSFTNEPMNNSLHKQSKSIKQIKVS